MTVPIHPEAIPGSPQELRWVLPAGTLEFVGEVAVAPASIQAWVDDGVITSMTAEPTALRIALRDGRSWRRDGAAIRTALSEALTTADQWRGASAGSADDVLRAAVGQVLAGEVGDFIRSHGGALDIVDVAAGVVTVSLGGTCAHCPASDVTLTDRFEDAVRALFPSLVEVRVAAAPSLASGRRLLGLFPVSSRG
ncbi:NifU family protein [Williamsia sp. MIQD14]|uniref:NifU family protein n=1 Tax=Williamsia sp. MIQD14 TaxID=3425703 RepID=UPI003DA042BA